MIKPYTENISDYEKDMLFLLTCKKYNFDVENDVLSDLVVEMAALIDKREKNILELNRQIQNNEKEFRIIENDLIRKIEYKEKEADHFKSIVYSRRKQQDKIRDINIITINNNFNNTFNSFDSEDGDDECGMAEDMDQA